MVNTKNKKIKILLFLVFFFTLGFLLAHWWVKNYVDTFLTEKLPPHFELIYSDLDINLLSSSIVLHNPSFKIKNKDSLKPLAYYKLETFHLNNIVYWDLLFNETLYIKTVSLKKPKLQYYPYKQAHQKKTKTQTGEKGIKTIKFDKLHITNGSILVKKQNSDSTKLSISNFELTVLGSKINLQHGEQTPLTYNSYNLELKNLILDSNDYETFNIDHINASKKTWKIERLQIIPKYDKKELSSQISKERDYINLTIPSINLKFPDFIFKENRLEIAVKSAEITAPRLEVYRDKLLPDDLSFKQLYSATLRNLNFNFEINEIEIKNGFISYAELVDPYKKAGELFFNKVDATIKDLSNLKDEKKTTIKIQSELMGEAPLILNWNFDVNNASDTFEVLGSIKNLPAQILNPFFRPNLNAMAEGTLEEMYFTFYGNNIESQGEMKMKYEDFKFKILRKNNSQLNKFLTAVGTLFMNDGSKTNAEGYRFGQIETKRNVNKSFFNYLWINVKSGLVSTLTGNGEK
ncbi:hypothetical protein [Mariniflexile sp. AS56]|uniref:hypothetical protein n=1 Tax=Mariniflexile sp. AS56 TaxID=3063957 RepID=UPI0026ECF1F8|nr:hypothetical protein [Mariniflexile sp. AS56]MDO7172337.1 hypothetical protein [Mariniflexile sp. AS56]